MRRHIPRKPICRTRRRVIIRRRVRTVVRRKVPVRVRIGNRYRTYWV